MGFGVLGAFILALAISAALSAAARPLARRLGFLDHPDMQRKEGRPAVPYGGGASMLLAFAGALAVLGVLCLLSGRGRLPTWLAAVLPGLETPSGPELKRLGWVAAGSLIVFAVGMLDDLRKVGPLFKFGAQILAALLLVVGGVRVTVMIPSTAVSAALTVLWVVGITNSFNLLDNMDGLSAGIAAIAAFIFAMVAAAMGQVFLALSLAMLAGVAAGFLVHNFQPARLYMGDAGSYWLGFTLAALTVEATFYSYSGRQPASPVMIAAALPLLILAVPVFDTVTVLWIRFREGRPLWVGDRSHLSHRLVGLGLSVREAVLAIYLLTLACGIGALLLKDLDVVGGVLVMAQAAAILAVVAILEGLGRGRRGNGDSGTGNA